MKRLFLFTLFAFLLSGIGAFANISQQINFQGILTDGSGNIVSDGTYSLTFNIYTASDKTGGSLWNDTFSSVQVEDGVFNVTLGSGSALNLDFDIPY